jgi:exodeoxyribonuclease VII large subunit
VSPVANVARMRARLDAVGPRPHNAVCRSILLKGETLKQTGERLTVSRQTLLRAERIRLAQAFELTQSVGERLSPALKSQMTRKADRLEAVSKLFDSLSYKSVLKRGFALVRDAEGRPLNAAEAVQDGQALVLEFADGKADATGGRIGTRPRSAKPRLVVAEEQGALF